ncbi:MAG: FAD-binding oxidoreductase [Candidatus Aquirickettsiella gammari]|jgi:2-polyprenyl-6-methoxyphenol hydroxylase-like FAD-dependent oxidoreductase|uniref:FAD-binding oxidoreductase n=1 Tax=Candidatus Aquirickettsiella gammari TaxID=2016198 RepID=A0A370CHW3_9COXI|nr:MAG: FAD-binding oxidoreductase [Candidatus Aquirickettsiella gammari]
MRNISIIGAGQAGLQLGIGLLKSGYNVSIYTRQKAEEVLNGNILSSPSMFHSALQCERKLGLNFWDKICPENKTVTYTLSKATKPEITLYWQGKTSQSYQAIDQRLKFSYWMEEFTRLGGQLIVQTVVIKDLNCITEQQDLTIVTGGKGEISQLFPIDESRSIFNKAQRVLCCLYVKDVEPRADSQGVRANVIPGVGEYFITPGLTITGPCEMMLFEGLPGSAFDCWKDILRPDQRLTKACELLRRFVPWEAELCQKVKLTDEQATLQGSYTPVVKKPTFRLSYGKPVLGLGDSILLNDPIGGQGANNACQSATFFLNKIKEHESRLFTEEWMQETFETYWKQSAQWATKWTNLMLKPSKSFVSLLRAASHQPNTANWLANGFDIPRKILTEMDLNE